MQTPRKQLINYAISIIKEVATSPKDIEVHYDNNSIYVWFLSDYVNGKAMVLYKFKTIKENRLKYLEIIKRIRA
jgi:hypothetical protein